MDEHDNDLQIKHKWKLMVQEHTHQKFTSKQTSQTISIQKAQTMGGI